METMVFNLQKFSQIRFYNYISWAMLFQWQSKHSSIIYGYFFNIIDCMIHELA